MNTDKQFGVRVEGIDYLERLGAYGIAIKDGAVLIEIGKLGYFLPGGGVDEGESMEQALQREFLEETGYELRSLELVGQAVEYIYLPEKDFKQKKIGRCYLVELGEKGTPTFADGHVCDTVWIPFAAIRERMYLASQWWAIEETMRRVDTLREK